MAQVNISVLNRLHMKIRAEKGPYPRHRHVSMDNWVQRSCHTVFTGLSITGAVRVCTFCVAQVTKSNNSTESHAQITSMLWLHKQTR